MFDKLVESTKQTQKGRGRFFAATGAIYAISFTSLAILTIVWANPTPIEAFQSTMLLAPPVPQAPAPQTRVLAQAKPTESFVTPSKPPTAIIDPAKVMPKAPSANQPQTLIPGAAGLAKNDGITGAPSFPVSTDGDAMPPEPRPVPTPKPSPATTPTPAPTPKQDTIHATSVMISSKAIHRIQPPYPAIARAARVAGAVQIQLTIGEDGRVDSAGVVAGHPLLREAALQAARQWTFSPTLLNGKAMKVIGIITFNFTLN